MDVQMPLLDGLGATEQIRAFERKHGFQRTPIIAVTALTMENYRELCLQKSMDDYLSKPIKKQQFQTMVKQWINKKPLVLIADDSEDYRWLLQMQFEKTKQFSLLFGYNGSRSAGYVSKPQR
jgi:response regulator RpfG family c-di-GMP phosphodiesterase